MDATTKFQYDLRNFAHALVKGVAYNPTNSYVLLSSYPSFGVGEQLYGLLKDYPTFRASAESSQDLRTGMMQNCIHIAAECILTAVMLSRQNIRRHAAHRGEDEDSAANGFPCMSTCGHVAAS